MDTVILAAGEGTRMRPLTADRPKPMLPVADRPLLEHTIEAARSAGADRIILVIGYEGAAIRDHFGDFWDGLPIEYVEQSTQDGTADALQVASQELDDEPFAVLNGDGLYDPQSLRAVFEAGPAVGAMRVPNPSQYGVLELSEDESRVTGVIEKPADPPSDLVNTGAYVFPGEAVDWLDVAESERGERELTDVLDRACESTTVAPVEMDRWLDVGRPWELLDANEWLIGERSRAVAGNVHPGADLQGRVVVEPGATVRHGVVIEGPAMIREGATVGPNAYIRGTTLVDRNAQIGHAVEVKNSVVMAGASISHLSYVGDSVIGPDVNFGAGTVVANLRHDDQTVRATVKGESVDTGRRKFGCVCGPGAKTGINTSLNVGVTLDAGATTNPGAVVRRD
ncbi:sugar phosphate nucleotidyltransferase [Halodesulfurarchaeum sp. HSR-GB]|uniref:bifunctional sugar-1-phosphate nucleotidylyltransferase/acetyltransferase n=1 Tax=Halodesulfurarchaeum sp. HSR-GB TaxID=3074077 RepID=UPI002863F75E|nr:bifunctional sugar-1-phosphate nucleotidylyltransferase/acetyltransferase [Halodesulfurarchaeum sp. HSR-GB]MDR5657358.1 sugar phosphate nucleotidyltransferase [Halodesulfurarchaeum sp. HSR-GB]